MTTHIGFPFLSVKAFNRLEPGGACSSLTSHRLRAAALCAVLLLGLPTLAAAQGGSARSLLLPTPASARAAGATAQTPAVERTVARQRPVDVDFSALDPQSSTAPAQLDIELFDGQVVTLERDRVESRGRGNYTWYGKVQGQDKGQKAEAIFSVENGRIAGSITLFERGEPVGTTYEILSDRSGGQALRKIDPAGFPPDHPPGRDKMPPPLPSRGTPSGDAGGSVTAAPTPTAAADSGATIDVMVVYSNQTAAAAGTAIGAQIQLAVDKANATYANSGITTRLRLVHYEPANYNESGDFNTDLNWLTSAGGVQTARNTYGADLVSLIVESMQYCGLAWLGPWASYAFSVVNRSCASGNLSFPHELGHNFGALHDPYVDPSNSPYAYGHGLTNPAAGWRTVMAYNDACAAAGRSCTRIPYFSTPALTYGGLALGTATISDNARVHNSNAVTVANFRPAADGCTYALAPAGASVSAAASSGVVGVTAGTGCAWNSASNASWLSIAAGSGTSASGTLNYAVAANAGAARSGSITIGSKSFAVSQAANPCTYTLSPGSASTGAEGGAGSTMLTTGAGCTWTVSGGASWLSATPLSGTGSAAVNWSAAPNSGVQRFASLNIGGLSFTVSEAAAATSTTAIATLSASSLSFGNVKVGASSAIKTVKLTNTGGGTLTIASLTSGGANPGDFARSGSCAANTALGGGQACTLQFAFRPSASGSRSASLSVGSSAGSASIALSGRGK